MTDLHGALQHFEAALDINRGYMRVNLIWSRSRAWIGRFLVQTAGLVHEWKIDLIRPFQQDMPEGPSACHQEISATQRVTTYEH